MQYSRLGSDAIQYNTTDEFNVDSKAEYSALSSTRSQKKKKLKQTKASAPLIQYRYGIREGSLFAKQRKK